MAVVAKEKHRLAYKSPDFTIDQIDLDISLDENCTKVIATSRVKRQGNHPNSLVLDGEELILHSVLVDKKQPIIVLKIISYALMVFLTHSSCKL